MEVYCTRPGCPRPQNYFADLDDKATLKTVQQKFCTTCGMPLILVGRYIPQKLLGRGGFGAAFLASDRYTPTMRECVVKQFQPAGNLSNTQLQLAQDLFEREALVLEQIGHEHKQIPDLFAFFPMIVPGLQGAGEDQFFYLVQEYIQGQTLEEILQQKGKFSEAEALEVLGSILPVLQFVHDKGIIHRDIKPSNIMRHNNGKFYLLDFGAVKQVANAAAGASSSTGIYSMGFAPPEQMSGSTVFPSTDLYALAVTIVSILTGVTEMNLLIDAYSNQWQWRSQANVSPKLADVLDKMLLNAANQRFQSAREVWNALKSPSSTPASSSVNPPPQVQPPSQPAQSPPPKKPVRKQSLVAPFSTVEMLAGAAFSGFEGGLIAIALYNLLQSPLPTLVIGAVVLGGLVFAQTRRWIEKLDLLIIPGITCGIIFFVPLLRGNLSISQVLIISVAAGLVTVALISLFRLIYKLLSLIL
ncbi:serine/threonine-protein kinase [Calothrix rhizosoleniae]|uniref:serine/threonine-protein kinase n=1 Tax=Calothrix rhizosoleniae TaxID=888997 RepID=UPI000B4A4FD2|nr:serine/threonine-protein kinase [Calothrix rhizosoleniae]